MCGNSATSEWDASKEDSPGAVLGEEEIILGKFTGTDLGTTSLSGNITADVDADGDTNSLGAILAPTNGVGDVLDDAKRPVILLGCAFNDGATVSDTGVGDIDVDELGSALELEDKL